ncbi:hypothetical protein [Halobacillus massiliensis]|uniref:hypothetical protein n=1 Tax=Halobacillus massiliensis TaxID=1926286 RepID=UPI0009E373BC|nr:hypothetical protein [Halobacillus massiliensis]
MKEFKSVSGELQREKDVFQLPSRSEVYRDKKQKSIQRFSMWWFRSLLAALCIIIFLTVTQSYWSGWIDLPPGLMEKPVPYHEEIWIKH